MSRYKPEQFVQAPKWVEYEVDMLIKSSKLHYEAHAEMAKADDPKKMEYWRTVQTCTLESFLVHYRNLKHFLNNGKYPTDVKASDYSDNGSGATNVVEAYQGDENQRINQLLTHISYKRGDLDPGSWDRLDEMERNILDTFEQYLPKIRSEFVQQFSRIANALARRKPRTVLGPINNSTFTQKTFSWWW